MVLIQRCISWQPTLRGQKTCCHSGSKWILYRSVTLMFPEASKNLAFYKMVAVLNTLSLWSFSFILFHEFYLFYYKHRFFLILLWKKIILYSGRKTLRWSKIVSVWAMFTKANQNIAIAILRCRDHLNHSQRAGNVGVGRR